MYATQTLRFLPFRCPFRRDGRCYVQNEKRALVDYYDVLQVDPDATIGEIKFNFRKLQKQHHPDISGNDDKSAILNQAYQTLIDPTLRRSYDRRFASIPVSERVWKRSFRDQAGLVGPVMDAELVYQKSLSQNETGFQMKAEYVVWLQEWAKTFMFAADLPLPLPLQCDDIENGVRLAFIETVQDRIRSAGELYFEIDEDEKGLNVCVRRTMAAISGGYLLGEREVMKAFKNAIKDKNETHEKKGFLGFELSGFLASAAAQFMPAMVTLPLEKTRGASYEAYHLKHTENGKDNLSNTSKTEGTY